ncbi:DivIVA domain-containing protein [Clostridium formicaceticum]|uniref:Septum formation initiator n=1 Tax=Clostridium formicaceticum TaxID=1497 RepID=A0AAC9RPG4_9CLOT|nr:DivIVA domain-containing protein [Clostridium formicaceticum]AOY77385.1 septum formation initiator [Clostridium formicaceticum]ARE87935.1 Septum site-determining protein DivIVA [Clostridium formicaceticum]
MLTPLDIQNKEFKKGLRGYKENEVDEFLDEIMVHYEKLFKENAELKDKMEKSHQQVEQYKNLEETLKNTLVVAQNTAEEVKTNAGKKAQLIIEEAEMQAKEIIHTAKKDVEHVRHEYEEVKRQMEIFKTRYKTLLQSQLEVLLETKEELQEG